MEEKDGPFQGELGTMQETIHCRELGTDEINQCTKYETTWLGDGHSSWRLLLAVGVALKKTNDFIDNHVPNSYQTRLKLLDKDSWKLIVFHNLMRGWTFLLKQSHFFCYNPLQSFNPSKISFLLIHVCFLLACAVEITSHMHNRH